jgi:hypothetical protein
MDEKPDQIMSHIESQRDQLGRNLNELETRVKGATDWRVQFDKNPMLMVGVALGGGLLLGSIVGGAKKRSGSSRANWSSSSRNYGVPTGYTTGASNLSSAGSSSSSSSTTSPAVREQRKKASDTLDHMKAALIGFATAKVKEFMSEALPGFNQHLDEAERKNSGQNSDSYSNEQSGGYGSGSSSGSTGSYGAPATTRTEQSANSPYVGAGQNTGLNV